MTTKNTEDAEGWRRRFADASLMKSSGLVVFVLASILLFVKVLVSRSYAAPKDGAADAKVEAVSAAMKSAYGDLFEGTRRDAQGRAFLRLSGHDFLFDDGKQKTPLERIEAPDMEDMFAQVYPLVNPVANVEKDFDPGRVRVEEFFKVLYGGTEAEVSKNLRVVNFCGTKVEFNSKCGAADALAAVAKDLEALIDKKPQMRIFTRELGGTFAWRKVAGTKRLSNHSFGTAIDLNVKKSAYWQWEPASKLATFSRKDWPMELVEIFERHGFVWGGKWWHFDTMHFEYRPELIAFAKAAVAGKPEPELLK